MTDPMGQMFLSYRHSHRDFAAALDRSLREHGIPVWRDVHDVGPDLLQEQIIDDLEDPGLAGGLVLVSQDVVDSEVILELELPHLYERWRADDAFFVAVILCPDVEYDDADRILAESPTPYDFSQWYMESLGEDTDPDRPGAFDAVVTAVLERRLGAIHETLDTDVTIECSLDTYDPPSYSDSLALNIDWSPYFEAGLPAPSVWNDRLRPALGTAIQQLQQTAPGRSLRFRGSAHLPAAFATGHTLLTTRGIDAGWRQNDTSDGSTEWRITEATDESGLRASLETQDVTGSHLAVFASISDDVAPEVGRTKSELPEFNGILELTHQAERAPTLTASQAAHAATLFQDEVRTTVNELSNTSRIHLFMAGPTGLAFLFGQQTNTLPPIQTYVLDTTDGPRVYRPAIEVG